MTKFMRAVLLGAAAVALCAKSAAAQRAEPKSQPSTTGADASDSKEDLPKVVIEQKKPAPAAVAVKRAATSAPAGGDDQPAAKMKPKRKLQSSAAPRRAPARPAPAVVAPAATDPAPDGAEDAASAAVQPTAIGVGGTGLGVPAASTTVDRRAIDAERVATNDVAQTLRSAPGVSIYQAGGVSSLPAINGLADDRVKILLNGMVVTSACGNHMNPALSYGDPAMVGAIEVTGGVTPVSKGGDSIAGTIIVEPPLPRFAAAGEAARLSGQVSGFYRSNNHGLGTAVTAEAATQAFSMRYDGSWSTADDYRRGGDGALVRSTDYEARNHVVTLSARNGSDLFTVRAALQDIPYQGFVNQRMDMGGSDGSTLGNKAVQVDGRYRGKVGVAVVDATAYVHHVNHYMNFLTDKGGSTPSSGMPMYTDGRDYGYGIKVELPATSNSRIRIGNELHLQRYDEWWNPVKGAMMMCCGTFRNIADGQRDRLGTFAEWEAKWAPAWSTLVGVRNDVVWMNAGDVQGYNAMSYGADAAKFNARAHESTDVNFDATALVRFQPDMNSTHELGYARKTRSPNLYERYAWSTNSMASSMITWFGDGNGYVGDLDLKPEVAHTASLTLGWHSAGGAPWEFRVTPYYTYVQDFIDVDLVTRQMEMMNPGSAHNLLRFANHDAELYGVNLSGRARIIENSPLGTISVAAVAGYVHGRRTDGGGSLYHMMPLNGRVALEERLAVFGGTWTNTIEVQAVDGKTDVDTLRLEPTTPAYALLNLRSSYEVGNVRFDLGVENLLDKLYYAPLGGIDFADWKAKVNPVLQTPVAGMGRSINAGMTVKF